VELCPYFDQSGKAQVEPAERKNALMNGTYRQTIDAKGRLNIPVKLRSELGERFFVTKGLDGCLMVYSENEWRGIEEKVRALPLAQSRNLQRMLFANAEQCVPDSQWRIVIPQSLREYASLEKDVTVIGVGNRAEIWNTSAWDDVDSSMTSDDYAAAMDLLGF